MSWSAAGAVADAVARARYMEKQMMARRALRVHMKRAGGDTEWSEEAEYEPFECYTLCLECGYLTHEPKGPCPGCGQRHWTDLRSVASGEAVRQMERRDRLTTPAYIINRAQTIGLALGTVTAVGLGTYAYLTDKPEMAVAMVLSAALGGATAALSYFGFRYLLSAWVFYRRPTFPSRWRLPLPLPRLRGRPTRVHQAPFLSQGELLRAPITNRPCLGYEVSVHFDAPGDKRPRMWILEEEHTVAFSVDDRIVEADRATLKLDAELVGEESVGLDESGIAQFLRKRGLFASEGLYAIFEAIIEPDQTYRLEIYDKPANAVAVVRPAR